MSITLEQLIVKYGVKNIDTECTDDDILSLGDLCDPWNLVGRHLGLTESQLSAIDEDNLKVDLKRLGVLHKWRSLNAFQATYRKLVEALLRCGKVDKALKVCQALAKKESKSIDRAS